MKHNLFHLYIFSLIAFLTITSCNKKETKYINETAMKVGYLAPDFSVRDKDNNLVSLSDFTGKVMLVEFWASWCSYCIAEIPTLNTMYEDYQSKNFEIIGISLDTEPSAWLKKVQDKNIQYTQLNDSEGFSSDVAQSYEVSSIPKMVLVNEEGYILMITNNASDVRAYLENLFN